MVVIAIIGILGVVITPVIRNAIVKAKIAQMINDFGVIEGAVELYNVDTAQYPPTDLDAGVAGNDTTVETQNFISGVGQPAGWDGPYLKTWPRNPFGEGGQYLHSYYNYKNAPTSVSGLCLATAGVDVYLQAGYATDAGAQRLKIAIDGHDFTHTEPCVGGPGSRQTGKVRFKFAPLNILYYIIDIEPDCF